MNLWIRTQNKKALIKVNELFIVKYYKDYMITDYPVDYPNDGVTDLGINLGIYKTKERALEVLDEIQRKLGINEKYFTDELPVEEFVYEMPKE